MTVRLDGFPASGTGARSSKAPKRLAATGDTVGPPEYLARVEAREAPAKADR